MEQTWQRPCNTPALQHGILMLPQGHCLLKKMPYISCIDRKDFKNSVFWHSIKRCPRLNGREKQNGKHVAWKQRFRIRADGDFWPSRHGNVGKTETQCNNIGVPALMAKTWAAPGTLGQKLNNITWLFGTLLPVSRSAGCFCTHAIKCKSSVRTW